MDSIGAMMRGIVNRGNRMRVFDWDRAASLIKERRPTIASAGLGSDWEYTGGTIYENGAPDLTSYTYLASNWATPELDIDGEVFDCWRWEEDGETYAADAKWPASALAILYGESTLTEP